MLLSTCFGLFPCISHGFPIAEAHSFLMSCACERDCGETHSGAGRTNSASRSREASSTLHTARRGQGEHPASTKSPLNMKISSYSQELQYHQKHLWVQEDQQVPAEKIQKVKEDTQFNGGLVHLKGLPLMKFTIWSDLRSLLNIILAFQF